MESVLINIGLIAVAGLIIYLAKKITDYNSDRKTGTELSEKVYAAAKAFANGSPDSDIRDILINSIDFNEEDIEDVLLMSCRHRNDADGGYQAFLNAARRALANY